MNPILALTLTASMALPAAAEPSSTPAARPALAAQVAALTREAAPAAPEVTATRVARMPPGGDSLKNGAIVGGVIAAAAGGGFIYYLCRALDDTGGNQECAGAALVAAGVAGLGGAAIGAGIDALFARAPALRMRVRF